MVLPILAFVGLRYSTPHAFQLPTPDWPLTRAERTHFKETSHYSDVIEFIRQLQACGAPITLRWMGVSTKGLRMPLIIAGRPLPASPAEAIESGKPIVYVEANIHAGEVEGKEAILELLRDYSKQPHGLLDEVILVIAPIYNIDGNEAFGPSSVNRGSQTGPDLIGRRENGQGLDLNRDAMKAESPEMQAQLRYVWPWNPDVLVDLHTTDGTRHGYPITYAPPMHPNTDPGVMSYSRDFLLPKLRAQLKKGKGMNLFDYGDAYKVDGHWTWMTYGYEGRYVTDYAGLRNRIAILSEAFSHDTFETRVASTYNFVDAILTDVASAAKTVKKLSYEADQRAIELGDGDPTHTLGIRFDQAVRGTEPVLLEKGLIEGKPEPTYGPVTAVEKVTMPVVDRYKTMESIRVPAAYVIPANCTKVVDLLRLHGVEVLQLVKDWQGEGEGFAISKLVRDARKYQNHFVAHLEGSPHASEVIAHKGDFVVIMTQPLSRLIFELLEPRSLDGVVAWGELDGFDESGTEYPIQKLWKAPNVEADVVP